MNETLKVLRTRRSCNSYLPEQVKDAELDAVLEAGTYAPTGKNLQSPIIIAIQNKEVIAKISKLNGDVMRAGNPDISPSYDPFYGAPTVIVVLADRGWMTHNLDGAAVITNMLTAAESLDLGARWISRAKEVFDSAEGKALLKEWGVTGDYEGVGNVVLGYRKGEKREAPPRKENYIYKVK